MAENKIKILGYQNIASTLKVWMKEYNIGQINNFPDDLIQNNGNHLIDAINFLVKSPLVKMGSQNQLTKQERLQVLY